MNAGPMCTRIGRSDGSGAVPVAPATPSRSRSSRLSSPARSWSVSTRRLVRPCLRWWTRAAARRYGEPPPQGALRLRRLEVHLNLRGCRYTDPRALRRRRAFGCRAALSSKSRTWASRRRRRWPSGRVLANRTSPGWRLRVSGSRVRYSWWPHRTHPRVEPRETQVLFRIVVAVLALVAVAGLPPAHAQLAGRASVADGDTVRVAGERVRLHGIDAPESKQTCVAGGSRWRCGAEATRALARRIGGRPIACEERDRDRYGRIVAVCRVRGEDLNRWMVRQGRALAYRNYSMDYVPDERSKRSRRSEPGSNPIDSPGYRTPPGTKSSRASTFVADTSPSDTINRTDVRRYALNASR